METEDIPFLFVTGELSTAVVTRPIGTVKKEPIIEKIDNGKTYAMWGTNNQLPLEILDHIGSDEVVFRAHEFNKSTHFGRGLTYVQEKRVKNGIETDYSAIPEVDDWMEANDIQRVYLEMVEDYEALGNIFTGMVLSKDKTKIARILRKQAAWCRLSKQDRTTRKIDKLFYNADWAHLKEDESVMFDVLNIFDPLTDLQQRSVAQEYIYRLKPIAGNRHYYDTSSVEVLINSGNFDDKKAAKEAIRALTKNQFGAIWHIEMTEAYITWKIGEKEYEKLQADPKAKETAIKKIKDEIDKWLSGPENKGKTLLTMRYYDKKSMKMENGVIVTPLENKIKSGDWIPSMQQYQADTYTAMGVDPSTVGISNQKDGMNSGSEKKNAFTNTQATLFIERINTLAPLYFAARFNGWTKKHPGFKWQVMDADLSAITAATSTKKEETNAS